MQSLSKRAEKGQSGPGLRSTSIAGFAKSLKLGAIVHRFSTAVAAVLILLQFPVVPSNAQVQEGKVGAANRAGVPHAQDHVLVKLGPGATAESDLGVSAAPVFDRWVSAPVPPGTTPAEAIVEVSSRLGF